MKGSYSPHGQIPWGIGFRSAGASESESDLSEQSNTVYFVKGYDSAVTATVTDSEDDLFFLSGKYRVLSQGFKVRIKGSTK